MVNMETSSKTFIYRAVKDICNFRNKMFVGELTVLKKDFMSYMNVDIDISTLLWEGTTTYIT